MSMTHNNYTDNNKEAKGGATHVVRCRKPAKIRDGPAAT